MFVDKLKCFPTHLVENDLEISLHNMPLPHHSNWLMLRGVVSERHLLLCFYLPSSSSFPSPSYVCMCMSTGSYTCMKVRQKLRVPWDQTQVIRLDHWVPLPSMPCCPLHLLNLQYEDKSLDSRGTIFRASVELALGWSQDCGSSSTSWRESTRLRVRLQTHSWDDLASEPFSSGIHMNTWTD